MALQPLVCRQQLENGYWWNNTILSQVRDGEAPPSALLAYPCPKPSSCLVGAANTSACARGYEGLFCATCLPGFGASGDGTCSRCWHPAASWTLLVAVFLAFGLVGFFGVQRVVSHRKAIHLPDGGYRRELTVTAKILMNFLQTVSFLGDFGLQWPAEISGFFATAAATSGFTTESAFVSCALGWPPIARFIAAAAIVPLVVLVPAVAIGITAWRHRGVEFAHADDDPDYIPVPLSLAGVTPINLFTTTAMVLLFLIYPMVTRQALQMFVCTTPVEGRSFLVADFNVLCGSPEHELLVGFAFVVLAVVTLGFPVAAVACLFPYRHRLDGDRAQRRFGFLYKGYSEKRFWYESVILLRKASVAAVTVLLRMSSSTLQLWAGILVQLLFLALHVAIHPFRDKVQSWLEMGCIIAAILVLVLGQGFDIDEFNVAARSVLSIAIVLVVVLAAATCAGVIIYDIYGILKEASIAQRVLSAWQSGQIRTRGDVEPPVGGLPSPTSGKRGRLVAEPVGSARIGRKDLAATGPQASDSAGHGTGEGPGGGEGDGSAAAPGSLRKRAASAGRGGLLRSMMSMTRLGRHAGPEAATASSRHHGFGFEDLPDLDDGATGGGLAAGSKRAVRAASVGRAKSGRSLRRSNSTWRSNTLQAAVEVSSPGAGDDAQARGKSGKRGRRRRGTSAQGVEMTAVPNPLARIRSTRSGLVKGASDAVHQSGLVRERAGSEWGAAGSPAGAAGERDGAAQRSRVRASTGGGILLPNSPWAPQAVAPTSAAAAALASSQARRQRRETLVSKELQDVREEVESRWREAVHPVWGTTYWYNRQTRQITWDMPRELELLAERELKEMEQWDRKEHPTKKIAFWVHPTLGKTWKRPKGVPLREEEGWWRTRHPDTGVPYFVNLLTRDTAWERPEGYAYTPPQLMHESLRPLVAALQEQDGASPTPEGAPGTPGRAPSPAGEQPRRRARRAAGAAAASVQAGLSDSSLGDSKRTP
ncbi:hypothetical protein FNF27_06392 [Cafeteria roenbergensis]|uniref:WW domain-containing protein n=2 Tax=Cafeteria roenbergensis TaxID=33653 RepID=A0A5A8E0F1_CAFRO|nr:hypothetical protein FNF27_06392 [Cafeteria roenbergensis]